MSLFLDLAGEIKDELVRFRRDLHRHPELAMRETRTAQVIEEALDRYDIAHRRVGPTGVLGILRGAQPGDGVVALRADIDALPIEEGNQTDYRSQNPGVMHACGHDAHTACLLGAARLLDEHRDEFAGEVRLIFQPGEETGEGAGDFLRAGTLDGVSRILALHCKPELPLGTLGIKPGLNKAAVDHFRIQIHGKATHVSSPELGADALYAASQIVVAIQGLVARRTSPVEPVILGIGRLQAGTTYNAVAEYAEMEGTTRTVSEETRMRVREWIDQVVEQTARISGAEGEVLWTDVCSVLINDPQVCKEVSAVAKDMGGELRVVSDRPVSLGGDNSSEYQRTIPGCYVLVGTSNPERPETQNSLHNSCFDLDEDVLPLGAALYAQCAVRWLNGYEN